MALFSPRRPARCPGARLGQAAPASLETIRQKAAAAPAGPAVGAPEFVATGIFLVGMALLAWTTAGFLKREHAAWKSERTPPPAPPRAPRQPARLPPPSGRALPTWDDDPTTIWRPIPAPRRA